MPYKALLFEKENHVATVTINRPDTRNSLNMSIMEELLECFETMDKDQDIRAVILTGGIKQFSAGFDIPMAISLSDPVLKKQMIDVASRLFIKVLKFRTPVIAAVSGPAMGAGFDLQVMADIRIYSETAVVGQVEAKVAVTALVEPLWKIVGLGRTKELMFSGRLYGAEEAYRIGLANFVYPLETFMEKTRGLALQIAGYEPEVMEVMKELTNRLPGMEVEQALRSHVWTFRHFVGGPAMVERMTAFLDLDKKQ